MLNTSAHNILELKNVTKSFGGVKAVDDLSVKFAQGEITALLGPNGAGKTTVFNIISGLLKPDSGDVLYNEKSLTKLKPWYIAESGVGRLFQDVRLFKKMTVLENIMTAFPHQRGEKVWRSMLIPFAEAKDEKERKEQARQLLQRVGLQDKAETLAEKLSFGQQKLTAIARLLAADAKLLLLDEPAAWVDKSRIKQIIEIIKQLSNEGRTVIFIEHNLDFVRELAHRAVFMETGTITVSGTPQEVLKASPTKLVSSSRLPQKNKTVLKLTNITAGYGVKEVLRNLTLEIPAGTMTALVGGNGTGKSTVIKVITGLLKPFAGSVEFDGKDITALPTFRRSRLGIETMMQDAPVFGSLSIAEHFRLNYLTPLFTNGLKMNKLAGVLSGGERHRLAVELALQKKPKLLLLDEPLAGVSEKFAIGFYGEILDRIAGTETAVLVVEHNDRFLSDSVSRVGIGSQEQDTEESVNF